MPNTGYRKSKLRSEPSRLSYDNGNNIICNCDAELRLGYGVAVSLAIFEAKRFCLLALELFAEWQVIHFAGGYRPVVLTFIDTSLGFPCALAAVFTIRKLHEQCRNRKTRKISIYLLVAISICAVLNVLTMVSIGTNISVRQRTISNIFNASMYFYETTEWYKHKIDQIQLGLQCCGHTSYADWFLLDWQMIRSSSKNRVSREEKLSGEIYLDRSVPFSCCNLRVLLPCGHTQMNEQDTETINVDGCSGILSNFLMRIVSVAYAMTTILVLTQTLLAFFLARIVKKSIPDEFFKKLSEADFNNESLGPVPDKLKNSGKSSRNNEDYSRSTRKNSRKRGKRKKVERSDKTVGSGLLTSQFSNVCQDSVSSDETEPSESKFTKCQTARIKPSVHMEHRVPMKKSAIKRIR